MEVDTEYTIFINVHWKIGWLDVRTADKTGDRLIIGLYLHNFELNGIGNLYYYMYWFSSRPKQYFTPVSAGVIRLMRAKKKGKRRKKKEKEQ